MNERITELRRKSWDSQTDSVDTEKLAKLILEDVMSICEDLGDKGMDGHHCVDAIAKKYQTRQWSNELLRKEYERGYADAMNWKLQNHLEHLPPKEKNTWVGLTDEEMDEALNSCDTTDIHKYLRIVEAKLKEKNT